MSSSNILLLCFTVLQPITAQQNNDPWKILVVQPYYERGVWGNEFENGLNDGILSEADIEVQIFYKYIGIDIMPDIMPVDLIANDLAELNKLKDFDQVVSLFPVVHDIMITHGDKIFPEVPIIFIPTVSSQIDAIRTLPNAYIIKSSAETAIFKTVQSIFSILPGTQHIYVTAGIGGNDLPYINIIRKALEPYSETVEINYFAGLPLKELLDTLSELPEKSAIFSLPMNKDVNNVTYKSDYIFPEYSKRADAPIFTCFDTAFGKGVLGGTLSSAYSYGQQAAELIGRIAAGRIGQDREFPGQELEVYDWRQMKRWNIGEDDLPESALVRFADISFLERYKTQVILVVCFIILQMCLIILLVISLRRRKRMEKLLRKNEEDLERSQTTAKIGGWEYILDTGAVYFTKEMFRLYNIEPVVKLDVDTFIGFVAPQYQLLFRQAIEDAARENKEFQIEMELCRNNGKTIWVNVIGKTHTKHGNVFSLSGTVQDITERKNNHILLEQSLQEKNILLKEVHHQVKNNLAVISSLLSLQSESIRNLKVQEQFKTSQNRIFSMALIHELLYRSDSLKNIDVGYYFKHLIQSIIESYSYHYDGIDLEFRSDNLEISLDNLIPMGLLTTEIVSNSLKHAFHDSQKPKIVFILRETGPGRIELVIGDNGSGLPEKISERQHSNIGFLLINELVQQIQGELAIDTTAGTEYRILFSTEPDENP